MLYCAALARIVFRSEKSVALTVPLAPTLVRIWIMSARLSEPSASSFCTRLARTGSFNPPGAGLGEGTARRRRGGAVTVTLAAPAIEPLLAATL